MQIQDTMEPIFRTLSRYDPLRTTICVGGAAMAVQLHEAGAPVIAQADVDVLCSKEYFTAGCAKAPSLSGVTTKIREPYGTSVRALSPVLDIYPVDKDGDILPFSASEALGGKFYPTYYEECLANEDELVFSHGFKFLPMVKLLLWTAISGREKDIVKVDAMSPLSFRYGLISVTEREQIEHERNVSAKLRQQYPERHFARVG